VATGTEVGHEFFAIGAPERGELVRVPLISRVVKMLIRDFNNEKLGQVVLA
jgi:hypothetical protein